MAAPVRRLLTLAAFLFVFMFTANFLFLVMYFPPFQQQRDNNGAAASPARIVQESSLAADNEQQQQQQPPSSLSDCPRFGCPRYPPELTAALNTSLVDAFQSDTVVLPPSFPDDFASQHHAMLTQQGKSHKFNQDRSVYFSPFRIRNNDDTSFLAAIFDGHGVLGHLVAQEVVEKLPPLLAEKLKQRLNGNIEWWRHDENDALVASAFTETFAQVNQQGKEYNFLRGGCTASVTLRYGSKIYIANTGDSQTIVVSIPNSKNAKASSTTARVEFTTRKDKPYEPDEMERISRMGGKIHINPLHPKDARVVVKSLGDTIALAMSRSIGDWEWKKVGVIADPIVDVVDLNDPQYTGKELFLVAASDGMWDVRKVEFYANQFASSFDVSSRKKANNDKTASSASGSPPPTNPQLRPIFKLHDIFHRITPKVAKGYCDDITAIIRRIQ